MEFLNFVMALSPIIVVLVGILGFRQSAKKVAPVALIWTLVLAFTYFNITGATFKENVAVYHAPCVVERVVDKYDCCRDCLCEVLNYIDERQKCFGTYKTNPALNKKG